MASAPAGKTHTLDCDVIHQVWDNSIPPRLEIDPGDTVIFNCRDAGNGFFQWGMTAADVMGRYSKGHPLTGPVRVRGAKPGDVLQIDILDLVPGDIGFTSFRPDRGLLAGEFDEPYLKLWDLTNKSRAIFKPGIVVPLEPFLGVMGVALDEPGEFNTAPPRKNGGNMDIKQLTVGTTLYMPVWVDGANLSVGDGHAAQGDGEVCITAIETSMTATLRIGLRRDFKIEWPEFQTRGPLASRTNTEGYYATPGIDPDLMEATKKSVRSMIAYLQREQGLTREEAYALSSVCADLKVSEVVDAPNWVVTAFMPLSIFQPGVG
jgi:acetamidase/formamidase